MAQNLLGLDIGSSSVKGVLIQRSFTGNTKVIKAHMVQVLNGNLKDATTRCLQQFPRIDRLNASLDRLEIAQKLVTLPTDQPDKIRKLTPFQLEGKVPFLGNALTDGTLLYTEQNNQNYCLLSALNKDDLAVRKSLISESTAKEADYQIDALAVINLVLSDPSSPANVVLIDCGHSKTVISILKNGNLITSRVLRDGLTRDTENTGFCEKLTREVKRTILSSDPAAKDYDILFTGGAALDEHLLDTLRRETQSKVSVYEWSYDTRVSSKYITALALANCKHDEDPIFIDFFHTSRPHFLFNKNALGRVAAVLLMAGAINYLGLSMKKQAIAQQIAHVKKQITKHENQIKSGPVSLPEGENHSKVLELTQNRITLLKRTKLSTARTLFEATKTIKNTSVTLMSLKITPDHVVMEAQSESIAISDRLKANISASPYFDDVKYEKFNQTGPVSKRMHHFFLKFKRVATAKGAGK